MLSCKIINVSIAEHARRHDAPTRAPHAWLAQLADLGAYHYSRALTETLTSPSDDCDTAGVMNNYTLEKSQFIPRISSASTGQWRTRPKGSSAT